MQISQVVTISPYDKLLTGFDDNRWSVGPEDEMLPFCYPKTQTPPVLFNWISLDDERPGTRQNDPLHNQKKK